MTLGRAVTLIAIFVVWSVLAFMFVFVFAGGHVCGILDTVPTLRGGVGAANSPAPTHDAAYYAAKVAACDRPDVGAIAVFGTGYAALVVAAVQSWRLPRRQA